MTIDKNWNAILPCNNCIYAEICKKKDSIHPAVIPSFIKIKMTCSLKESLEKK